MAALSTPTAPKKAEQDARQQQVELAVGQAGMLSLKERMASLKAAAPPPPAEPPPRAVKVKALVPASVETPPPPEAHPYPAVQAKGTAPAAVATAPGPPVEPSLPDQLAVRKDCSFYSTTPTLHATPLLMAAELGGPVGEETGREAQEKPCLGTRGLSYFSIKPAAGTQQQRVASELEEAGSVWSEGDIVAESDLSEEEDSDEGEGQGEDVREDYVEEVPRGTLEDSPVEASPAADGSIAGETGKVTVGATAEPAMAEDSCGLETLTIHFSAMKAPTTEAETATDINAAAEPLQGPDVTVTEQKMALMVEAQPEARLQAVTDGHMQMAVHVAQTAAPGIAQGDGPKGTREERKAEGRQKAKLRAEMKALAMAQAKAERRAARKLQKAEAAIAAAELASAAVATAESYEGDNGNDVLEESNTEATATADPNNPFELLSCLGGRGDSVIGGAAPSQTEGREAMAEAEAETEADGQAKAMARAAKRERKKAKAKEARAAAGRAQREAARQMAKAEAALRMAELAEATAMAGVTLATGKASSQSASAGAEPGVDAQNNNEAALAAFAVATQAALQNNAFGAIRGSVIL